MRKPAYLLIFLMVTLTLQPVVANLSAPNDIDESSGESISIDGFVTTKFTSVGDSIEIFAHTRGHSGDESSTTTIVTADILHYPENDPIGIIVQGEMPQNPVIVDTVVLQPIGYYESDNSVLVWEGTYTIPINSLGGVFGASITMEENGKFATDNPNQIPDKITSEIEKLLQAIDQTWDTANPTMEMKAVFDNLNAHGDGDWSGFVDDATKGTGLGGSSQLWNNMIGAGYNNPGYDMYDGARFLEALMAFLESTDLDAGMAFVTGLFVYANEFPLPRTLNDFDNVANYIATFDPFENFTRFAGTEEFSIAYDAMLGSNEWQALEQALDNLANNTMIFESFQTLLRNIALISISVHPEAILAGLEAWVAPLAEEDYDSMTPFQKLVFSWTQMDVNIQDLDGDDFPDQIVWEYELLLNTTEGLQWQAKMESEHQYVLDGFNDFNEFDIELLTIIRDTFEDPAWGSAGDALIEFSDWAANASISRNLDWEYNSGSDDEGGDDSDNDDETTSSDDYQYAIFDNLHPIQTTELNKHALDIGFEMTIFGSLDYDSDYPNDFNMTVTDSSGATTNILLVREGYTSQYFGRFTTNSITADTYSFGQPLANYRPPCVDEGCRLDRVELILSTLQPSLIESMAVEVMDEIFVVSALGVIVEQDETVLTNQPFTVQSTTYDAVSGALNGANVDTAILRLSPGLGASAAGTLSANGELAITSSEPSTLFASYSADDAIDELSVTVEPRTDDFEGNDISGDVAAFTGSIDYSGDSQTGWDLSSTLAGQYSQSDRGVVVITTSGENAEGLEFRFTNEMPLPSTPPCTITRGNGHGSNDISIDMSVRNYYYDFEDSRHYYDPSEALTFTIDWGDGQTTGPINNPGSSHTDYGESGHLELSEYHSYGPSSSGQESYNIVVDYEFEHGVHYYHNFVWKENHGFESYDEDGNVYYDNHPITREEWRYCRLSDPETSATPSPPIINEFITNGPFEVISQQVGTSDSNGKATLSITPPHTGAYVSIVQSEIIRPTDGATITGIGLNFGIATQGSIGIGNLDVIDYFSGLPVYAANTSQSTQSITIEANGIGDVHHKASIGHLPVDFSVAFDEVSWTAQPDIQEITFNPGETTRSIQLSHEAPLSLIGIFTVESDSNGESNIDQTLNPLAVHFGLILHNPQELSINGALGPGQTTNIALSDSIEQASRILAVASPSHGFDPAAVDFSTITELISNEGVRPETDWNGVEEQVSSICETIDVEGDYEWNSDTPPAQEPMLMISVMHESSAIRYGNYEGYSISLTSPSLIHESTGQTYTHDSLIASENGQPNAKVMLSYPSSEMPDGKYLFNSGTSLSSSVEINLYEPNEPLFDTESLDENCDDSVDLTDQESYDLFDKYVTRFSTIAWGQGTSADLQLPYLSSPVSEYTVISVAQQGSGASANLVSATSTTFSVPNPEPPEMENLSVVFAPSNPLPGDIVLLTVTDESNDPVEGLSITVVRNEQTLTSLLSNENGQNSFPIPEGEIIIRISGGQYHPIELTISVTSEGIDDDVGLPGDRDGDGYGDLLDVFPDDPTEWVDTDSDNIGNNADSDDDSDGLLDDEEISATPQTNPLKPDTDNDGYCDGEIGVPGFCVASDEFPIDASEWSDSDSDGVGDNTDICDGTASGEAVDDFGCSNAQLEDNTDGIVDESDITSPDDDEGQQGSESSDGTSNSLLLIGGSVGLVAIIAVIASLILLRNRRDEIDEKQFVRQEELFETVAITTTTPAAPSRPPVTTRGEMYDGYEGIEFPVGSGKWFYRDPESGAWVEWR